jgi:D-amino peptidase
MLRLARMSNHIMVTVGADAAAALPTSSSSRAEARARRKAVYIACDSEGGTAMAEYWARNTDDTNPRRQEYRELLTRDCNACIEGCFAGGATEVLVSDDGMGGVLSIPEMWDPRAKWLRGPGFGGAVPLMQGLDCEFVGVLLIGFHSMQGSGGVLAHTYSSAVRRHSTANGKPFGELFEYALAAGTDHGVPILLVHGDASVVEEARQLLGERVETVAVKEGLSETRAIMVAPQKARQMLTEAAAKATKGALAALSDGDAPKPPPPFTLKGEVRLRLELGGLSEREAAEYAQKRHVAWREFEGGGHGHSWPLRQLSGTSVFEGVVEQVPQGIKLL